MEYLKKYSFFLILLSIILSPYYTYAVKYTDPDIDPASGNTNKLPSTSEVAEYVNDPEDYLNAGSYKLDSCLDDGSCYNGAVGLRFRVLRYTGNKEEPVVVGDPKYVINDSMLVDVTVTNGAKLPSSYGQLAGGGYGLTQILPSESSADDNWISQRPAPEWAKDNNSTRTGNVKTKDQYGGDYTFKNASSYQFSNGDCKFLKKESKDALSNPFS